MALNLEAIPNEVHVFLTSEVRSLGALELVLLLRSDPVRCWSAAELGRELRTNTEWADGELASLIEHALVERAAQKGEAGAPCYRFAQSKPRTAATEFALGWLAGAYPARRFSIIQALYAPQAAPPSTGTTSEAMKSFADAFKLRKDPPGG